MDRAQKRQLVSTLNEAWKSTGVMVVAHYKGMTVAQMSDFRKRMKDAGGSVKVAKNRLAKLALKDTDAAPIADLLKVLHRSRPSLGVSGGCSDTRPILRSVTPS